MQILSFPERPDAIIVASVGARDLLSVVQNLCRRNSYAQIKLGDIPSLNSPDCLAYEHHSQLNHIDYNEALESDNSLIIPKSSNGGRRDNQNSIRVQGKRTLNILFLTISILQDDGKFHHEENQQHPDLDNESLIWLTRG